MGYLGMRSSIQSKSKLKASVHWQTRGQFWKLNQVQLFRDQNERQPIRSLEHAIVSVRATNSPKWKPAFANTIFKRVLKDLCKICSTSLGARSGQFVLTGTLGVLSCQIYQWSFNTVHLLLKNTGPKTVTLGSPHGANKLSSSDLCSFMFKYP